MKFNSLIKILKKPMTVNDLIKELERYREKGLGNVLLTLNDTYEIRGIQYKKEENVVDIF